MRTIVELTDEQVKSLAALCAAQGISRAEAVRRAITRPKDEASRAFYERFDFLPSPTDPLHLFLLMKDLRRIVGKRG